MAIQIIANFRKPHDGILQEPDRRLRRTSKEVNNLDTTIMEITDKLQTILKKIDKTYLPWLGMAAPQLGYNIRVIAIKKGFHKYQIMINPEILEQKWVLPTISGCYSLKGLYLFQSPYWSKVKYMDLRGENHIEVFRGGMAVLMKQEIDHLNGKLIYD